MDVAPKPHPATNVPTFRELNASEIIATADRLRARIHERFPNASLAGVCRDLGLAIVEISELAIWLRKPHLRLRIMAGLLSLFLIAAVAGGLSRLQIRFTVETASELLQALEAGVNDVIFIGLAVFFVATWENRLKRNRALRSLHQLRSLAHIVDMHQLTKDPERILGHGHQTQSSPKSLMTPFELTRYLDYCSEMLSLVSKAAALHVQGFEDPTTLDAVEQIEDLTSGLSRKIWQKIMILDRMMAPKPSEST